jgi:hypothetical protein
VTIQTPPATINEINAVQCGNLKHPNNFVGHCTSKISTSKGPKLKKWLQKVDEENNPQDPDASSSSSDVSIDVEYAASYYEAMKKEQLYYVADLLFLTPEQLRDAVGCSFIMAKHLLAKAESELSRNK